MNREERFEHDHPLAAISLEVALVLAVVFTVLSLLYVLVPQVPAT